MMRLLAAQRELFARPATPDVRSPTFTDSMSLPVHRWFRYSAGFSAAWAADVLSREAANGRRAVLDPFAGSATTLLAAQEAGLSSVGLEPHPFISRVAAAKLRWNTSSEAFSNEAKEVACLALQLRLTRLPNNTPALLVKCFSENTLLSIYSLIAAWAQRPENDQTRLVWLAVVSIIRSCSPVGTAQWQYVLPNKSKTRSLEPFSAFESKVGVMASDMAYRQQLVRKGEPHQALVLNADARTCAGVEDGWADFILTSPPYANNYDYADATRLEMTLLGEISGWSDLQKAVRRKLMRSCTQHVSSHADEAESLLGDPLLCPIKKELTDAWRTLAAVREQKGGKKAYHAMIVYYFYDLAQVWRSLRRKTAKGVKICFVVGDSAPYGVHLPVERWLGELALSNGFCRFEFDKVRDRNIKWKNRKHRVPLQEGCLWVYG